MVLRFLVKLILFLVIAFVLLATLPGLLDIHPTSIIVKPCPKFEGPLKENTKLNGVEKILENEIEGPESIAFYKGELYTGLADGRVVRIKDNKVETVAQLATCGGIWEEHICGRPLGLRFDASGNLFVANAYKGLLKVDIKTGKIETLYSSKTKIDGRECHVVNDLDVSKSGDIYFSDSSKYPVMQLLYDYLEGLPNGRVLHYGPKSKETKVLYNGVGFANGIQLSPKEDYLLICETLYQRILKYHLKGTKKGQIEVFAENLPGVPDNIRLNPRGNYWIGQCSTRIPGKKSPLEILGPVPIVRRVLARLVHIIQSGVYFVKTNLYSHPILDQLWYRVAHFYPYAKVGALKYGLVLEMDQNGKIVRSLHATNGSIRFISEATEYDNHLYLGSPWHEFLGKIKLD